MTETSPGHPLQPDEGTASEAPSPVYLPVDRPTPAVVRDLLQKMDARYPDLLWEGPDDTTVARRGNGLDAFQETAFQSLVDSHLTAMSGTKQYPVPKRFVSSAMHPGAHGVLRRLDRIVGLPHLALDTNDQVVWRFGAGYDLDTQSWHQYPVPDAAGTREDYHWLLDLVLGGFEFESRLGPWIAEAALLVPLLRPVVPWVPGFLVWAKAASAGKTLLTQLIGRVHLGSAPRVDPIGVVGWERDYSIGAALQYAGPAGLVILDNLVAHERFDSAVLASILTARAPVRTPRLPKFPAGVWVDPAHLLMFATGIAPHLGPELQRRFLPVELQRRESGSWTRSPDQIERRLDRDRARVVAALVWAADHVRHPGFTLHPVEVPSYVEFGQVLGGLLMALHPDDAEEIEGAWAALPDLLLRGRPDDEDVALLGLLTSVPQDSPGIWPYLRPGQLLRRLRDDPACMPYREHLASLVETGSRRARETRLGMRLAALVQNGAVHDRIGVEERPHRNGGKAYRAAIVQGDHP